MAAETAEQRAAKLAELRRLTPEQEAAAVKAAQRIEEVAAAAEAAPEEERAAATWDDGRELWTLLLGGAVEPLLAEIRREAQWRRFATKDSMKSFLGELAARAYLHQRSVKGAYAAYAVYDISERGSAVARGRANVLLPPPQFVLDEEAREAARAAPGCPRSACCSSRRASSSSTTPTSTPRG